MSKSKENYCIACAIVLNVDDTGVKCVQGHDICSVCTPKFVQTIFEEPLSSIPVKCTVCKHFIPSLTIERQLSSEQLEIYQLYMVQAEINKNERTQACTHCHYFEIWLKSNSSNFFYCKNPKCKKITCVFCYKDVNLPNTNDIEYSEIENSIFKQLSIEDEDEEEKEYEANLMNDDGIFYHFKCGELNELKTSIEKVIEKGNKMRCPNCKLSGRKDNACTHMTCAKCATVWCYFCGMRESELCDVNDKQSIYDHNIGWQYLEGKCPMFLSEIFEIDDRWNDDDEECLNRFHNLLMKKILKNEIEKIGLDNYNLVLKQFPSIKSTVCELDELNSADVKNPFIKRISKEEYQELIDEWN